MFVDQAGELIADIMTANRSLASIPSASAILDTSNYTFWAISYGKDADGFRNHSHAVLSPSGDSRFKVYSYQSRTFSGYNPSATALSSQDFYSLYPQSPTPFDTKLESRSTLPIFSAGLTDFGQCLNSVLNSTVSSNYNTIGCFASKAGTTYCIVSSLSDPLSNVIVSGTIGSYYNLLELMDKNGFLTFKEGPASAHYDASTASPYGLQGILRIPPTPNPRSVVITWILPHNDAGSLLLFGGVYHLGLWYLDLKQMLKDGYYPPFSFNNLNNIRKYKLFAKKTFNKNLISVDDITIGGLGNQSGFKRLFELGQGWPSNKYWITFSWEIKFT